MLSTWPHGHAVTFSYGLENAMPGEDLHLSMLIRLQAHLNRCAVGKAPRITSFTIDSRANNSFPFALDNPV